MNPSRRALVLAFVAAWILLGPIAMAFGGCFLMGDCEALCGTITGVQFATSLIAIALARSPLWSLAAPTLPTPALFVIEPPPRLHLPA